MLVVSVSVGSEWPARTVSDRVYIVFTYGMYVVLVVVALTLLFLLGVVVVFVQEALRVIRKRLGGILPQQKPGVKRRPGILGAPITVRRRRSYASTARS